VQPRRRAEVVDVRVREHDRRELRVLPPADVLHRGQHQARVAEVTGVDQRHVAAVHDQRPGHVRSGGDDDAVRHLLHRRQVTHDRLPLIGWAPIVVIYCKPDNKPGRAGGKSGAGRRPEGWTPTRVRDGGGGGSPPPPS
jgi:hypothetical protein